MHIRATSAWQDSAIHSTQEVNNLLLRRFGSFSSTQRGCASIMDEVRHSLRRFSALPLGRQQQTGPPKPTNLTAHPRPRSAPATSHNSETGRHTTRLMRMEREQCTQLWAGDIERASACLLFPPSAAAMDAAGPTALATSR